MESATAFKAPEPADRFHHALWQAGQSVRAAIEAAPTSDEAKALADLRDRIDDIAAPESPNEVALTDGEVIAALAAFELCWKLDGATHVPQLAIAYRKIRNAWCCAGSGRPGPGNGLPVELS